MKTLCPAFLCLWCACVALAADPVVILRDDGTYVLQPNSTTLVKVQVIDQRTGTPTPNPNPTPTPVDVASRVKAIAEATGDVQAAQLIATIYRAAAEKKNGKREEYLGAVREGTDSVLRITGTASKWVEARKKIGDIITEEEAKGPVEWPKLLGEIAAGMEQSSAHLPAIPPEIWTLILEIIRFLISKWFGGGGV